MWRLLKTSFLIPACVLLILLGAIFIDFQGIAAGGRPVIVYAHPPCPPQLMIIYAQIFDAFRHGHPAIEFRVERVTSLYEQNVLTRIAGGVPPDIIFIYPHNFTLWVSKGAVLELNPFIESTPDFSINDYYANIVDIFTLDGRVYGIPKDATSFYLAYNADIFDREGIPYPDDSWDWEKFLEVARKLTKDLNGDGKPDQFGAGPLEWNELVWQNGGRVFSEDGKRCLLNEPAAIEALQFYSDLQIKYHVAPNPIERDFLGDMARFQRGEVAMVRSAYPHAAEMRNKISFRWDIALLPGGKAGRATLALPSAYAISSGCKHPEAAFKFIKFLTRKPGMTYLLGVENAAFKQVANSPEFLQGDFAPEHKDVVVRTVEFARAYPKTPHFIQAMDWIRQSIVGPISDPGKTVSPEEAVRKSIDQINKILGREE